MGRKKSTEKKPGPGLLRLLEIAGTKKWWLIFSMLFSVLGALAQFVPYVAVYLIITELARHAIDLTAVNRDRVFSLGYLSLGAVALYGLFTYVSLMLSHIAAFNILYELRVRLAEKLSRLPLGFFTKKTSGEIKKIMAEDVERIELFVAHHIPDLTSAVCFPLVVFGYMFYLDWRLALVALIPLPLALAVQIMMFASPANRKMYKGYHDSLEKLNSTVVEYVRGMPVVKVFNQTVGAYARLKSNIYAHRNYTNGITRKYAVVYPLFLTVISSSLVFILPMAVFLLLRTASYSGYIPTVFLFLILGGGMFFPLFKLMWAGGLMRETTVGLERIDDILRRPEMAEPERSVQPADSALEFKNVTFAYNTVPVLENISFVAEPDTVTALVGPSGAGKTTIGHLCARFWDVQEGEILVGGVNIKDIRTEELMDYISFVFQDTFLFFDTIEENIRMGNSGAIQEEVVRAARAAQCHEFITDLPQGYKTLVGEGGTYLSGGEQQRIALARVILKNSPIVVLDEATAFADPENEGKILAAFAEFTRNKTVIVIAHRLSTIAAADKIITVDKGTVVEQGRHEELVREQGLYTKMWETYSRARDWAIDIGGQP